MLVSNVKINRFLDELIEDMGLYTDRAREDYRKAMNEALVFLYAAVIRHRKIGEGVAKAGRLRYTDISRAVEADVVCRTDVLSVLLPTKQYLLPPGNLLNT